MCRRLLVLAVLYSGLGGAAHASERDVSINGGAAALHGTLETAEGRDDTGPAVLILGGSGPTDRDGNSTLGATPNELKQLADSLSAAHIISLRIDKRGIGASAAALSSETELRIGTYVDDAVAWVNWLEAQPRVRCVVIAGHSEGALIAFLTAQRTKVCGVISMEGAGRPLGTVLREQFARALPEALRSDANTTLSELEAGRRVANTNPASPMFRPSVQPYLISELSLDPAAEARKVAAPLLLIQGSRDSQVTMADVDLLAKARPDARTLIVPDMIHPLKIVPAELPRPAGGLGALPLAPAVATAVISFVRQCGGSHPAA